MMKTKNGCAYLLLIFLALALLLFMLLPPIAAGAAFDAGYPIDWGYPTAWGYPPPVTITPTVDPWCEEAQLLGLHPPKWCPPEPWPPVIGEAISTVASQPDPTDTPAAIIKVSGRQKGRGK